MSEHLCHAHGCKVSVPPKMLMCSRHWKMVPSAIQRLIWKEYVRGQEIRKDPTGEYLLVQRSAIWAVFVAEGGCAWSQIPKVDSSEFMVGPSRIRTENSPNFAIPSAPLEGEE